MLAKTSSSFTSSSKASQHVSCFVRFQHPLATDELFVVVVLVRLGVNPFVFDALQLCSLGDCFRLNCGCIASGHERWKVMFAVSSARSTSSLALVNIFDGADFHIDIDSNFLPCTLAQISSLAGLDDGVDLILQTDVSHQRDARHPNLPEITVEPPQTAPHVCTVLTAQTLHQIKQANSVEKVPPGTHLPKPQANHSCKRPSNTSTSWSPSTRNPQDKRPDQNTRLPLDFHKPSTHNARNYQPQPTPTFATVSSVVSRSVRL